MLRFLEIAWNSFKMALTEFRSNKLRTFLSLFGITVGIFCIIGVLAVISSMEKAVKDDISSIAKQTVFIGKWENGGGPDYPWWKYVNRPEVKYAELDQVKQKFGYPATIAFFTSINGPVEFENSIVNNINYYGVTEEFGILQSISIGYGRNIETQEYASGSNSILIGNQVAEMLFDKAELALGKTVKLNNGKVGIVVGVISKKGKSILEAWDYDNSIIMPYQLLSQIKPIKDANPLIMVQTKSSSIPMNSVVEELQGVMRSVRKINPGVENNFAVTDIDSIGKTLDPIITGMNIGGWAISGLCLIVGMFGVANIMFVTVRERTSQIGLKKAIGAKRSSIMMEFLLESAFLCILGGLMGLLLVFGLTKIISSALDFPVYISFGIFSLAIFICIITGILAGIIPAFTAAKMDPVVAIRSK